MTKKIMLLALAVVSAAFFALPAVASAQEMEVDPGNAEFTGTGPEGFLKATGEPTITCEKTDASGKQTSTKTATVSLDFTGCHITILGATIKCRTVGSALDNTVKVENTVHFITINNKPGILVTPPFPTLTCGSGVTERKIEVGGNGVIGTVTSPACNVESKSMTVKFTAKEGKQEHMLYTGVNYDLTSKTEPEGAVVTSVLEGEATLTSAVFTKMTCQ